MSGRRTELISIVNETTATEGIYEVSHEIVEMLRTMGEDELSRRMPKPSPRSLGYERATYAAALAGIARDRGISDEDIMVRETEIPSFFFDSGWAREETANRGNTGTGAEPAARDATEAAFDDSLRMVTCVEAMRAGLTLAQGDIRFMLERSAATDAQYERQGEERRLVRIRTAGGCDFAVVPTWDTCNLASENQEYEQPYEAVRQYESREITVTRWVPRPSRRN